MDMAGWRVRQQSARIASYEGAPEKGADFQIPWPPDLTVRYQNAFYRGFALNRAWQELPGSMIAALVNNVRTRVLRFALELKDELDEVDDNPSKLAPAEVEQSVINNIFGGNVPIAASAEHIAQIGSISIKVGHLSADPASAQMTSNWNLGF
jgi:hypothetical protein